MGKTQENEDLSVKIPSFFRCPISLDVMKSPVSLCTGVTYDRSSIQRWLDSGNHTCPATMQPLPSTDLVPNLTLHRLITLWSQASAAPPNRYSHLLDEIRSKKNPSPSLLRRLSSYFDDDNVESFDKNQTIKSIGCTELLIVAITDNAVQPETKEEAVAVAKTILVSDCFDSESKELLTAGLIGGAPNLQLLSLISVLREAKTAESRANAAVVLNALVQKEKESSIGFGVSEAKESTELVSELIRMVGEVGVGVDAGLSCLVTLSGVKRTRVRMVRAGIVPVLTRIISEDGKIVGGASAEKAMKVMEAVSGCTEGREAICDNAERTVPAVLRRMMKVGREGTEAAAVVLWSVCHLFRDRRAQEALVAAKNGGLTKVLLLMQSDCSAAVREMAGDLLRVFRVNSKCCLGGYDTKTAHIMPF